MGKEKIVYIGWFLTTPIKNTLEVEIPNQHITLYFKPTEEQIKSCKSLWGKVRKEKIIGYGISKTNEGVFIYPSTIWFNMTRFVRDPFQHITIGRSHDGKPVDTGKLKWSTTNIPTHIPKEIEVKLGYFSSEGRVVFPS